MSYSNSFPQQRPTLNLDFANSGKLDSRISFSRADTPPTYAAPSAVHYWSNEKHKSSENLVTQSDGSDWIISSADYTKTASQNGPDGSTNATKYTEKANGNTDYEIRSNNFTPIANKEITYSVWFKQTSGSRNYQQLRVGGIGTNQAFVTFNLTNGTVDQTGGTLGVSASVNDGPTGWYQCVMKFTPTTTTALSIYIYAAAASGGELPQVTGDTGNSFTMFGAQASTTGETVANATSGQIHREYSSTLKSVSNAGDPRFEYDPTDGQSVGSGTAKGLLIEAQATNLLTYSEDWANSDFTKFVAITSNAGIAPTGELAADLVTATSSAGDHITRQSLTVVSGQTYSMSVFAKASGCNFVRIGGASTAAMPAQASFDLVNGTVGTVDYGTAKIEDVGNGFYRCSVTGTAASNTSTHLEIRLMQSDNTPSWTGDDYSGLLLFGQMAEQSSSVSSYIKTTSSSVSRAADSCSVALTSVGNEVTVAAEAISTAVTSDRETVFHITPLNANTVSAYAGRTAGGGASNVFYGGSSGVYLTGGTVTAGSAYKFALRTAPANHGMSYNGGTVATQTTTVSGDDFDTLHIGSRSDGSNAINGHVKRLSLYSVALSNVELQSLTSNP